MAQATGQLQNIMNLAVHLIETGVCKPENAFLSAIELEQKHMLNMLAALESKELSCIGFIGFNNEVCHDFISNSDNSYLNLLNAMAVATYNKINRI